MTGVLNEAMREGIPEERRTSTITPIYKQKGDPLECNNVRGIKLLSHTLKLCERVVESSLRTIVNISERQYGFQPGKSTIQPLSCLPILSENTESSERSCMWCLWIWKRPMTKYQGS